jgi:hypothetical protein
MPSPSKMFAWGKKPSESTIAGTGASSLTYPESPASKQSPSTIASAAAPKSTNSGTTTAIPGAMPATNPALFAAAPKSPGLPYAPPTSAPPSYTPPSAGAAAVANGYATGPYNTFSQSSPAVGLAASGGPARPTTSSAPMATGAMPGAPSQPGMPNAYAQGNPYAVGSSTMQGLPASQVYAGAAMGAVARPSSLAATAPMPAPTTASGYAMPNSAQTAATRPAPYPTGAPAPGAANPMAMPQNGGLYSPIGTAPAQNSYAQLPTGMPNMQAQASAYGVSGMSAAAPMSNQVPAQTAAYGAPGSSIPASTASYRPGSTSRPTGYNFSTPSPEFAAPAGYPASVAGATSNPGYSLPPASTLNR